MNQASKVATVVSASILTREVRAELEAAALECTDLTHTALLRFAKVCTPERVLALLDEMTDLEDELGIQETAVLMHSSAEAALRQEVRKARDALTLVEAKCALQAIQIEELDQVLSESAREPMVSMTIRTTGEVALCE